MQTHEKSGIRRARQRAGWSNISGPSTTWQQDVAADIKEQERRDAAARVTVGGVAEFLLTMVLALIISFIGLLPLVLLIWIVVHLSQ
jgi:hypothetical protein